MTKEGKIAYIFTLVAIAAFFIVIIKMDNGSKNVKKDYSNLTFNEMLLNEINTNIDGNTLVSPYSMKVALSMLRDGANSDTEKEISSVIGTDKVSVIDNKYVHVANAVFVKDNYKKAIEEKYSNALVKNYNSEVLYDDFKTPDVINNWVNKHTDGMIKKILNKMNDDYVMGLANAIAIDVDWEYPFECSLTNKASFTKNGGKKIDVEMMHETYQNNDVSYIESDNAKGIILPYEQKTGLEFIAIRPNGSISDYIKKFKEEDLKKMEEKKTKASSKTRINLSLPRFKYDYEVNDFIKVLKNIGIKTAFNKEKADFTNIMSKENMEKYEVGNLYVGEAIHKTHIDLNEKGTKAAAVTYFGLFKSTAALEPDDIKYIDIKFDKTFLYMIRDKKSGIILFMGVVDSPNQYNGAACE